MSLFLGSALYTCDQAAPLGDAFERSFREALLAPGSSSYRFKWQEQSHAGQSTLTWRSPEHEYSLELQQTPHERRAAAEAQLASVVPALARADQHVGGLPAQSSEQCLEALKDLQAAATDRSAVIDACAKLLRSRTRLIHALQQGADAQGLYAGVWAAQYSLVVAVCMALMMVHDD